MSRISSTLALTGTAFLFAMFPFISYLYIADRNASGRGAQHLGAFNTYFAMSASILATYVTSALCNQGWVGVREVMFGTLTGAIGFGAVASFVTNVCGAISVGALVGLFSTLAYKILHPRTKAIDTTGMGLMNLVASVLGGVVVAPAVVLIYWKGKRPSFGLG